MTDPVTAATIAALVASKFMEGGMGKVGEKVVENLWSAIANRFKGKAHAEQALQGVAIERTQTSINKLADCLDEEMKTSPEFATEIKQLASQIINLNQMKFQQLNNSYGRDQIVMNNPKGDFRIGG